MIAASPAMFPPAIAARSYRSLSCADFSMPSSFLKNGLCESSQFKGMGRGAQFACHRSMNRGAGGILAFPRAAIAFAGQFVEEVHYGLLRGLGETAARDVLRGFKQSFSFSHFTFSIVPQGVTP